MFNITPLVRTLIIINVAVFLLQSLLANLHVTEFLSLWDIHSDLFRPYQFFTYMFAHGSFTHIFFNMIAFASFAPILEGYWGDKKFLTFYIATGMGAGVIYAAFNYFFPGNGGYMLGASGAIYGILMAFGMLFPNMELMLLFPPIPIKAKYMVFLMGFITYALDRSGTVAHLAHFGGAFIAFLLISYWRTRGK
ncbi:MAG: rhomboid family intramembrane serine protease [Cytophagales bacterium]|jgi:membrane associated rhomboid family serine protease|nr:rhomboid family intramembrane serine protease [Cytophagales bacterium]MCA6388338.1 rhomboid family intramembrane serine protease [Cytophagales bacterium]MCA6392319.1 rhomboid family intramembrane serine protease [Cytophagales bacterium]MCA6394261.1 rhomboid family intramembrane serine protease [Cytophagales bacterium]MCA6398582.1 rhomboid family intramembrane serine protease [Cytophagales bacterium]